MIRLSLISAVGAALVAISTLSSAAADAPVPTALAALQSGQWQLRSLDAGVPPKTICLGDPRVLLQLKHDRATCSRTVITNNATQTVVLYSCNRRGNGRTSIRVETPRVVQIESQGIADKAPFDVAYEGRRVGNCPATGQTAER
jgi:hypothetical protein